MTNIIDLEKYKSIYNKSKVESIPEEDQIEIEEIQNEVKVKYLKLLDEVNKKFEFTCTPEQAELFKRAIDELIKSYELIVLEAAGDIVEKSVEAFLREKYS